uniref:Uncharacterized protein n=1 Tax=Anguilla anguilla TaxID=7936 RepID=A0A0E9P9T2_ANGAN
MMWPVHALHWDWCRLRKANPLYRQHQCK